jgi:predicted lipoprotein with Yx(FWY)xxD motif
MKVRNLLLGIAAVGMLATTGFALADELGGAVKTTTLNGKANGLTDAKGMTLYTYDTDTAGVSNCYDKCAVAWPPLWVPASTAVTGDWTLIDRKDATGPAAGMKQVAYKGMPLYTWFKDKAPGDITGDNVGKVWHIAYDAG